MTNVQIWSGPNGVLLPPASKEASEILPYASNLTKRQQQQIVDAFDAGAYDMAAEYAWKKAMTKLKETISTLGMKFIGEMLNRPDIDELTPIDSAVTDHIAIQLAEQLGVINKTAALKLRQGNELIIHYFSRDAQEELDHTTAFGIIKSSVQYILGEHEISIALEFSQFRERLLNETLKIDDFQVDQIINSPLFYIRTVITILVTSIKNDIGARLERALANLNLLVPHVWSNLGESDKWNIGTAYRDVTAAGNSIAISGVKSALSKVRGFDYVPENLRSSTFIKAAQQLLDIHFAHDNFHFEPGAVRRLAMLGSTIPSPALLSCIQAYLAILLGMPWGAAWNATGIAEQELAKLTEERWYYYFEKGIQTDNVILGKMETSQIERFSNFLIEHQLDKFEDLPTLNQTLYKAIITKNGAKARNTARELTKKLNG